MPCAKLTGNRLMVLKEGVIHAEGTYEEFGEDFMKEHLEYELKKYTTEGLRPEYQRGISLF